MTPLLLSKTVAAISGTNKICSSPSPFSGYIRIAVLFEVMLRRKETPVIQVRNDRRFIDCLIDAHNGEPNVRI